jgi:N-acetylglutamate synthase/N-acetylornithine aminotransferase
MAERFPYGSSEPAAGAIAVTPHNTNALSSRIRAITINAGGTVAFTGWDGVDYATAALPAGTYPLYATHIKATGTSATGITGWI